MHTCKRKLLKYIAAGVILASASIGSLLYLYGEKEVSGKLAEQQHMIQLETPPEQTNNEIIYQGNRYRRNTYIKAILCLGIDRAGPLNEPMVHGSGGQADGIFLIAQDTARDSVRILMIPRDTMTEITLTDISGNIIGLDIQHLALGYAYGNGMEESCDYMVKAVSGLLEGLRIDGYMAISMSALPIINDGAGGVAVVIEDEGLENICPDFKSGELVTLKGEQAVKFIRFRDTDEAQSALGRMERQKTYVQGFIGAVKEKSRKDEGVISHIMNDIEPYMITNMTKGRYMKMVLSFLGGNQGISKADMIILPGKTAETSLYDEYYPDRELIRSVILDLFYRPELD